MLLYRNKIPGKSWLNTSVCNWFYWPNPPVKKNPSLKCGSFWLTRNFQNSWRLPSIFWESPLNHCHLDISASRLWKLLHTFCSDINGERRNGGSRGLTRLFPRSQINWMQGANSAIWQVPSDPMKATVATEYNFPTNIRMIYLRLEPLSPSKS